jgi:hypothetical protein
LSAKDEAVARRPKKDGSKSRSDPDERRHGGEKKQPPGELGRALKTVYDQTLREEVPNDFLDLLGKLS